tara:strand:- start:555 stop:2126 length:1572 start_codon:yes stop_codon:yes gene_type:complete
MSEREFKPEDKSQYSWRDHARELMRLKYGVRGKDLTEALIGESEEEKYMKYLIRNYGYATEAREELPESRPLRDLLNVQGGGPSDLGALDAVLMGVSGSATPVVSSAAAGIESAMLAGDAYGEYKKDNPWGAALMGAGAFAAPLLRYMNPPPTKKKDLSGGVVESGARPDADIQGYQLEEATPDLSRRLDPDAPDLSRRKAVQNIGLGLGALATAKVGDPIISQAVKTVDQAPIVRLGASAVGRSPPLEILNEHADTFLFNNKLVEGLVDRNFDFKKTTEQRDFGTIVVDEGHDFKTYDHEEILNEIAKLDATTMSVDEIRETVKEVVKKRNLLEDSNLNIDEVLTYEYTVDAIDTIDIMKDAIRHDPATQEALENYDRLGNMSTDELHEEFDSDDYYYDAMDEIRNSVEKYSLDPVYDSAPSKRTLSQLQTLQKQYDENLVVETQKYYQESFPLSPRTIEETYEVFDKQIHQTLRDGKIIDPLTGKSASWSRQQELDPKTKAVEEFKILSDKLGLEYLPMQR